MNYTLRQLEVYRAVGEYRSFTKAAEALHLTQPAVSLQFKSFADQFDFPLIEYSGRNLFFTELGQVVLEEVRDILDRMEALHNINRGAGGEIAGTLRLSVVSTGKYIMPYFLSNFMADHNQVDLIMDVTNKASVVQSLEENSVDFALISVLPKRIDLDWEELMSNDLHLVAHPEVAEKIDPTRLHEQTFLFRETGSATRQSMENFLNKKGIAPSKRVELTSNEAVKQSVQAGLGISIMPLIGIRTAMQNQQVTVVDFPGLPISTTWKLVWRKNKNFSPVAKSFLTYLRDHKDEVITKHFS